MAQPHSNEEMVFLNGKPDFVYDEIRPCFPGKENGLIFRLVNHETQTWAFYNDTDNFRMVVKYEFSEDSHDVHALGRTTLSRSAKACICTLVVEPLSTQLFIQGKPVRIYSGDIEAQPLGSWQ